MEITCYTKAFFTKRVLEHFYIAEDDLGWLDYILLDKALKTLVDGHIRKQNISDAFTVNEAISDNFGKSNIYICAECNYKAISVRESGGASHDRSAWG